MAYAAGFVPPPALQGWEMPSSLSAVASYMDAFMARDSWKATHYSPELVIKGWERHGVARKSNL